MSLSTLPYDLLFNIAQYLTIDDIHHLQVTCKSLRAFTLTRPVYRALAHGLLARSRPLPLPAFQRLSDLSTRNLIKAVDRAHNFEKAWRVRAPRPARTPFSLSTSPSTSSDKPGQWYTKISAPPNEEIDWLSPITSSYTLCATKSGRVICWDVARDVCLAEWDPRTLSGSGERLFKDAHDVDYPMSRQDHEDDGGHDQEGIDAEKKWELWKCRVEFDERAVYFTMARVLEGSYDDNRVMEFVLMKLAFPSEVQDYSSPLSQTLSFLPESHCCSPYKTPANSPPPSSQGSSPQDSTLHTCSTVGDCIYPTRSPLSTRTTSPLPDCTECGQETLANTTCSCAAHSVYSPSGSRSIYTRNSLRVGALFEAHPQPTLERKPIFFPLTSFHTTGVVMNVFLLDPPRRLLSAFVWVASSNTIGLYVLLDWAKDEYVFVDTGVGCLISSNWSCILHEDQIVIHSEEADAAYQHFYPLNILRNLIKPRKPSLLAARIHDHDYELSNHDQSHTFCRDDLPAISMRLSPMRSISKKFVFPAVDPSPVGAGNPDLATSHDDDDTTSVDLTSPLPEIEEEPQVPPIIPLSLGQTNGLLHDDSEYGSDDDGWSQEAVTESSRLKGKGKADSEDEDEEVELGPSSQKQKDKGKMREVDAEEDSNEESTTRVGSSSSSHHSASSTAHSSPNASTSIAAQPPSPPLPVTLSPAPNPYPFPPWYPESAHFVRQWWPTLPGVPRLSCTVVLLAAHDPDTHRTRFVLAQHYFRVPIVCEPSPPSSLSASDAHTSGSDEDEDEEDVDNDDDDDDDDEMLHLWYVSTPFEVVCVLDGAGDNEDDEEAGDRPRPLVAVDFGHAVWIEYAAEPGGVYGVDASRLVGHAPFSDSEEDEDEDDGEVDEALLASVSDISASTSTSAGRHSSHYPPHHHLHRDGPSGRGASESSSSSANPHEGDGTIYDPRRHRVPKCLRFVTFPPVFTAVDRKRRERRAGDVHGRGWREEAVVRTLEIPDELDLDGVETINIDQSQGAVILSVKDGKIFILRYE